ncbi:hypothetical protein TOPH_03446 [Tolypocladium ophioglossoides CBS 100239]|uniref:Uncharacterized protein n=1 Tax=Tolypocladium ophioglossoides (strain CBS 100239) TaxID=1163406 RepID=A0A0L0NDL0_TOLOC|nr:hypothetical protein TOPH_03446 [Tolypocladium ophioglossoides CBS 100239]
MHFPLYLVGASLAAATATLANKTSACPPFPSSMVAFSADFKQPLPPLLRPEFKTSFVQHKWDQYLSHITAGYISNAPAERLVRADQAIDGEISTSTFNYANVTKEGFVDNTLTTYSGNSTKPDVWRGYVNSNFPLFAADILVTSEAVFGGLVQRPFVHGLVASWQIMYQGAIPVTVYVSNCNVMVGYEYFSPDLRTRVITNYFNTEVGGA